MPSATFSLLHAPRKRADAAAERPTQAELRKVFDAEVHQHPRWPRDFEAALADPVVSRLLRLRVAVLARPRVNTASKPARHAPRPARRGVDRKSLAAGERQDE